MQCSYLLLHLGGCEQELCNSFGGIFHGHWGFAVRFAHVRLHPAYDRNVSIISHQVHSWKKIEEGTFVCYGMLWYITQPVRQTTTKTRNDVSNCTWMHSQHFYTKSGLLLSIASRHHVHCSFGSSIGDCPSFGF